jgi:hypothetical protein
MLECIICGKRAERHHIVSRGSSRSLAEVPGNIVLLCRTHHSLSHSLGQERFFRTYGLTRVYNGAVKAVRLALRPSDEDDTESLF